MIFESHPDALGRRPIRPASPKISNLESGQELSCIMGHSLAGQSPTDKFKVNEKDCGFVFHFSYPITGNRAVLNCMISHFNSFGNRF